MTGNVTIEIIIFGKIGERIRKLNSNMTHNGDRTEWSQFNSVCYHTSDDKIGRTRTGNTICLSQE